MALACNVGRADRWIRLALGLGLMIAAIVVAGPKLLSFVLGFAGALVFVSGAGGS